MSAESSLVRFGGEIATGEDGMEVESRGYRSEQRKWVGGRGGAWLREVGPVLWVRQWIRRLELANGSFSGLRSGELRQVENEREPVAGVLVHRELRHSRGELVEYLGFEQLSTHTRYEAGFAGFGGYERSTMTTQIPGGVLMNAGLITSLVVFLLAIDWSLWRNAKLPLEPFYFSRPFLISAALSGFAGWLYIPIADKMKIHQILREEGPRTHSSKKGTPTMGGLFFIPIGIAVASQMSNYKYSWLVSGSILATLAFAGIGLIDDLLSCIKGHNYGLPGWIKFSLQVAVGACFSFWLDSVHTSMPYDMKLSVHLPQPFGLVYLGKYYLALTTFCFASMANGVNLTDGLDGLAGGVAAWAFIGMSIAILAISPDLAVLGASMAGACVGFLFHNRYKASIFMGDTGSLGLGGALATMACCTGMFLPLFISSGVFVMEVLSVICQVLFMKVTRKLFGVRRRIFRMSPIHHHFELCGHKEPVIVASAYFISCILALIAGYIGIIST
ncbi:hypothetical protein M5K25_004057 [Dendrobium thyrsiflorum]|uniref:Phospho-N-acetylmuramoyl-pentapeptide-transferase n=1 Tax=Dendrobium thyrsiflorum TaxID=117978 RepID=A0ABD0VSK8_DENTH